MGRLNVLYQFNEKYVPYAGVSITSLLENNKNIESISLYILAENVGEESKKKLMHQVNLYNRVIEFIDTEEILKKMQELKIPEYRGCNATNMKLFVADYLSQDVDRLIYIDCDTIVCDDLGALMTANIESKPIAMVFDSLGRKHKLLVGLSQQSNYYNAGIILFDIKKWKRDKCTERIINHVKTVRAHYMSPDQDLLNVIFENEIFTLDISYNLQPIHFAYKYKVYFKYFGQNNYYSENEIKEALDEPRIVHTFRYLGEFPWHEKSLHPNVALFDKYMELSLWRQYVKENSEQNGVIFKVERMLYKYLPKKIFLFFWQKSFDFFIWKSNNDSIHQKNNKKM